MILAFWSNDIIDAQSPRWKSTARDNGNAVSSPTDTGQRALRVQLLLLWPTYQFKKGKKGIALAGHLW